MGYGDSGRFPRQNPFIETKIFDDQGIFYRRTYNVETGHVYENACVGETGTVNRDVALKENPIVRFFTEDAVALANNVQRFSQRPTPKNSMGMAIGAVPFLPWGKIGGKIIKGGVVLFKMIPGAERTLIAAERVIVKWEHHRYQGMLPEWQTVDRVFNPGDELLGDFKFAVARDGILMVAEPGSTILKNGIKLKGTLHIGEGGIAEVVVSRSQRKAVEAYLKANYPEMVRNLRIIVE